MADFKKLMLNTAVVVKQPAELETFGHKIATNKATAERGPRILSAIGASHVTEKKLFGAHHCQQSLTAGTVSVHLDEVSLQTV